jgi:hypothetical protein
MNEVVQAMRQLATLGASGLEKLCLPLPQRQCGVIHRFGPGICIREVTIPADTFAIGHVQKFDHMNVMLSGRVTMVNDDGSTQEVCAPFMSVGKPGRKIGYVHEDMTWLNVYATDLRDAEAVEAHFVEKSQAWQDDAEQRRLVDALSREVDRLDFQEMLIDVGFDESEAIRQSENPNDQIPFPYGGIKVMKAESAIHGVGMFATDNISAGEVIAPARIDGCRTPAGRYVNHSKSPNAEMRISGCDIILVAIKDIRGYSGGRLGEEITTDYRTSIKTIRDALCLQ